MSVFGEGGVGADRNEGEGSSPSSSQKKSQFRSGRRNQTLCQALGLSAFFSTSLAEGSTPKSGFWGLRFEV